mgnify:CR=1 FL=1
MSEGREPLSHLEPPAPAFADVDRRIVGIKNVSLNERYLWHGADDRPVLPPTILTEAIAQVGAVCAKTPW